MPTEPQTAYQLKVTLSGARPPIWRRLLIEPGTTFHDLHRIIQVAMGWQASHLHLFQTKAEGRAFPQENCRNRALTLFQLLGLIDLEPEHASLRGEGDQVMRRTALFEGMFTRT